MNKRQVTHGSIHALYKSLRCLHDCTDDGFALVIDEQWVELDVAILEQPDRSVSYDFGNWCECRKCMVCGNIGDFQLAGRKTTMKRFHLGTLLLLTLLACAFVSAQFWTRQGSLSCLDSEVATVYLHLDTPPAKYFTVQGIPFRFREYLLPFPGLVSEVFDGWMLALNCCVGFVTLAFVGYGVERWGRRKP